MYQCLVCAHSALESNTASSSLRSGNFKTPFSWAVGLGKNVNVISHTVRTCMQIPCTYPWGSIHCAALFCPATAAVCLDNTFWYSKLTAWIRLWHTGRSTSIVRPQDSVRVCENTVTLNTEHSDVAKSHRYDVPEVEFKKMTPILRDFCLSGLKRVFVVLCKFQIVLDACPRRHSGP